MHAALGEYIVRANALTSTPRVSVLTPFHRHDPSALLTALASAPEGVEFVLLDDGSGCANLLSAVISAASRLKAPARVIVWSVNRGRAAARNRLIQEARGEYVLFLDADMTPDSPSFLHDWLRIVRTQRPSVAFGGLSIQHARRTPETALHETLFGRADCRPAWARQRKPAQSIATANLLVRRDFALQIPFDETYVGWGFEDIDWALTAARHAPILHIDNAASHCGLDSVDTLMRKFAEAGPNFARLAAKHPDQVSDFAAHRAARLMKLTPARGLLRALTAWLARDPLGAAPMMLRCAALKVYRVSHYAEHLA